jgi:hypothetical protein
MRFVVGTRVRTTGSAGINSGKLGIVVRPELDGRGIPKVEGAYRPFVFTGPQAERVVLFDDGTKAVVSVVCLRFYK